MDIFYRKMNVLKSGDVVYRCSKYKSCKKSITTDKDGISVVKTKNDHTCNMESDERKSEAQVLRVRVRKASGGISKRPSTLIRSELQTSTQNNLLQLDVTNASKAIYRERRKNFQHCQKVKMMFMMLLKFWTQKQISQKILLFLMTGFFSLSKLLMSTSVPTMPPPVLFNGLLPEYKTIPSARFSRINSPYF